MDKGFLHISCYLFSDLILNGSIFLSAKRTRFFYERSSGKGNEALIAVVVDELKVNTIHTNSKYNSIKKQLCMDSGF